MHVRPPSAAWARVLKVDLPWRRLLSIASISGFILLQCNVSFSDIRDYALYYLVAVLFYYLEEVLKAFADPKEPPMIPYHGLPFLGHVIGMFWHGAKYFDLVKYVYGHLGSCFLPTCVLSHDIDELE